MDILYKPIDMLVKMHWYTIKNEETKSMIKTIYLFILNVCKPV